MSRVTAGELALEVELHGAARDPTVVLVSGFTQQLTDWSPDLLDRFVSAGYRVVTFDNRDVGRSERARAAYLLTDLAADTVGILDALGVGQAHLLGVSMGGMIAQQVAIESPARVASLTSVMSTTGRRGDTVTTAEAGAVLASGPVQTEDEYVAVQLAFARVCGSPDYPSPAKLIESRARVAWARGYDADGVLRQFRAIFAPGQDRTEGLQQLNIPALVIHGDADPLIGVAGGRASAAAIPGAELWVIPGMGHDLPAQLEAELAERLTSFWGRRGR